MVNDHNLVREYTRSVLGKTCAICKLELRAAQIVLQCPHCLALFHANHLVEWLETESTCPVCQSVLSLDKEIQNHIKGESIELPRQDITPFILDREIDDKSIGNAILINPKYDSLIKSALKKIGKIIYGFFFISLSLVTIIVAFDKTLSRSLFVKIFSAIISLLVFIVGANMVISSIFDKKEPGNIWKQLIFTPKKNNYYYRRTGKNLS